MTIGVSMLLAGMPPSGVGIYDPRARRDGQGYAFYARNPGRNAARDWVFTGPGAWAEDTWQGTLDTMLSACGPLTPGIIPDPEGPIVTLPQTRRRAVLAAMGRALTLAALRVRVCVTSHGGFPIEELAPFCGRMVSFSPQLYYDAPTNARKWARWRAVCGNRMVPSVAGPNGIAHPPDAWSTEAGYQAYVNGVPNDAPGCIIWDLTTIRPSALAAIRGRFGGVRSLPFFALSAMDTWGGLVLGACILAMVMLSFAAVGKAR